MKYQKFKVLNVKWKDEDSGQSSIEIQASNGQTIVCFCEGFVFTSEVEILVKYFYYLEIYNGSDDMLNLNPNQEKSIVNLKEWDYEFKGEVFKLDDDTMWVDCGGISIPVDPFTNDSSVVGQWVGFSVERLEAEVFCEA